MTQEQKVNPCDAAVTEGDRRLMEGAAVTTRATKANEKQPIKPLIVPPVKIDEINCEELIKQQKSDGSLSKLWKHEEEKRVVAGKNKRTYEYTVKKESPTGSTVIAMLRR